MDTGPLLFSERQAIAEAFEAWRREQVKRRAEEGRTISAEPFNVITFLDTKGTLDRSKVRDMIKSCDEESDDEDPPISKFSGRHWFLSNFWVAPVSLNGKTYQSVEHAYQASKTTDTLWHNMIREAATPAAAKRLGRTAPLREHWDCLMIGFMRRCLRDKFSPGTMLADQLLATGNRKLVEGNTWGDTFWGVCRGKGQNMLGRLLMEIRYDLRKGIEWTMETDAARNAINNEPAGNEYAHHERGV